MENFDYCVLFEVFYHLLNTCARFAKQIAHAVFFTQKMKLWHTFTDYFVNDRQVEIGHSNQTFAGKYDI